MSKNILRQIGIESGVNLYVCINGKSEILLVSNELSDKLIEISRERRVRSQVIAREAFVKAGEVTEQALEDYLNELSSQH